MEREDSFHSVTSSSSDLSISSRSNASLGRPQCEYEEVCSHPSRSWQIKDREERMEREDSFHSVTSSSSDLSISSRSSASLGRPQCEYEEVCSHPSRSWDSSHSPLDADALQMELQELLEVREKLLDVWIIVNNKDLTDKARSWLRRVDKMVFIVNDLRQRRNGSLFSSSQNRDDPNLRESITTLSREGEIFVHAFSNTFSNTFNNVSRSIFVGHEDILSQLGALLGSEGSNIIGIEGPRGIGKTRIIQEFLMLNEKSSSRIRFDAVFLTTPFYGKPISEFQVDIAERINLSLTDDEGEEQRRTKLLNALSNMKFLLVLDDLRSVVDLKAIGIPRPTTGSMSKIVITSRSEKVCTGMEVNVMIRVPVLSSQQSWELFRNLIRYEATEDAEVEEWGRELVRNCRGLPSAIIRLAWGIDDYEGMEDSWVSIEEWMPQFKHSELLCEYWQDHVKYRRWRTDASWDSSHSPLDAYDALQMELQELLEVRENRLDAWMTVNDRDLTLTAQFWLRQVDKIVFIVNKLRQMRNDDSLLFSRWENIDVPHLRESITTLSHEIFLHDFSDTFSNMFNNVIDHEDTLSQRIFVGQEDILFQLGDLLGNEGSSIIGITGPSGIGKTRILREFLMLNEKSSSRIRFNAVFLTTSPHEKPISAFQDDIAERINLSLPDYYREEQRRMNLYNALSDMKFLLVLDNLQSVLDLEAIGIPWPTTGSMSKIVVTSCSAEVCKRMRVDVVIHVPALSDEQSWELFRNLIRFNATEDAEAEKWGRELIRICRGLPSAIISLAWGIDESTEDSGESTEERSSRFKYSELLNGYWQDHVNHRRWRSDATRDSDESRTLSRNPSHSALDVDALQEELQELQEVRQKLLDEWIIVNDIVLTLKAQFWLRQVDKMVFIVYRLRLMRNASLLFSRWKKRDVPNLRESITTLSREGQILIHAFNNTFSNMFNNVIEQEDTLSRSIFVGHEDILSQLGALLGSEGSNIIGITGPSGIGKTRILRELLMLNEKSSRRIRFNAVFLTTPPHEKPISAFQYDIAERINLSLRDYNREEQRRMKLYSALSDMKFLLVLDGLQSVLDLEAIGIPRPTRESMSKIVVTSRSEEVCQAMGVDVVIHVPALSDEQSWELFYNNISNEAKEDADVEERGREFIRKRRGLPSAIITFARDMNYWERVRRTTWVELGWTWDG